MPQHTGTFASKTADTQISRRPFRPSITNPKTTTNSQFFLRSRQRNAEVTPAFVRTTMAKNDCTRIQETLEQRKVDFEPFDAKAYKNHKIRVVDKTKWPSSRDFQFPMKSAALRPEQRMTGGLAMEDPF